MSRHAPADPTAPSDPVTGPALRLLQAVEVLAACGTLSQEELQGRLGISKSATWRLVQNLRTAGWVRTRLGGRCIELAPRLLPLLSNARGADAGLAAIIDRVLPVAQAHGVHLDLLVLDAAGRVVVHDSTRQRVDLRAMLQVIDDASELTILSAMPSARRAALLAESAPTGLPHLRTRYDAGPAALGPIHDAASDLPGYAWEESTGSLIAALRCLDGRAAALRIVGRNPTTPQATLIECFNTLRRHLRAHVERFGGGRSIPIP